MTDLSGLFNRIPPRDGWIDCLPVGVYSCDAEGRIQQYNARAAKLWGREPKLGDADQKFCGAYRLYTIDGSELPHAATPMAEVLRTGVPARDQTVRLERPDGEVLTVLVNIEPLLGAGGEVLGAVNCFQDITELHEARAAVASKEQQLNALLESLPAAVYTTDAEGRVTFFNRAAAELAGRRPVLGDDRWCVTWRLRWPDGNPMGHHECPMAVALCEQRPVLGKEAIAERPDGSRVPFLAYPTPLYDDNGEMVGAVNMLVDITERKNAEDDQRLLINELNHRVKNTLATVQSLARQTLDRAPTPQHFIEAFSGRLNALASAHTLLTRHAWRTAELHDLIVGQLVAGEGESDRIRLTGPEVCLGPQTALHLALAIHELGTNARKYGALSDAHGTLDVAWDVEMQRQRRLQIRWREVGGPPVSALAQRGFGSTLIERSLRAEGGQADIVYEAGGVRCDISLLLPEDDVRAHETLAPRPSQPAAATFQSFDDALKGLRVLVVEDEPFLVMDIEAMLTDAGCDVVGPATDVVTALKLARSEDFDVALLDANLRGEPVDEIAAALTGRGIPFAFASGYGREGLPASFRGAPLISKPFDARRLTGGLMQLTSTPAGARNERPQNTHLRSVADA